MNLVLKLYKEMKVNINFKKFLPITFVLILTGCGIWTDFTTFFNLYFNTRQLYDEVQLEIAELIQDPFELKEPVVSNVIKTDLISIQEKTSRILQHESESSYFDDALFMSGYAFYYNDDYVKAIRKFQELASLKTEDYDLKSKLWMAKSNLQLREFDKGMKILREVRDSAIVREDEEVLEDAYKVIIAYHIDREEIETAINQVKKLIEVSDNDELKAIAAYRMGLLYLDEQNEEEAVKAFNSVLEFSPDFETEFDSKFELAKLNKELGNIEQSREMLDELYNEGKYEPFWGDVYYQLGLIEYEAGNYEKAFDVFTDVNRLYGNSNGALEAQLMLGEIMRNVYADYDSAKTYYDKVKNSNSLPELKEKAVLYSQSITTYLTLKGDVETANRQITYILEPQEFLRDSLAFQRFLATQKGEADDQIPLVNQTQQDTTSTQPTDSTEVVDSTANILSSRDSLFAQSTTDLTFDDDYILETKPVYPSVGIDSLDGYIAQYYFALGNLFFTDLIRPDSAYYYYDLLLTDYPETKYKPRALFALGAYFETTQDTVKSDSLYLLVYDDYKTHPIANEAAKKLGKPELIRESDPAQAEFLEAEAWLETSEYDSASVILRNIIKDYPESIYKPKSIYTVGWLYENELDQPDSAAKYYAKLVKDYRNSEYTIAVRNKVTVYESEMLKKQNESRKGSAETQQPEVTDSTEIADSNFVNSGEINLQTELITEEPDSTKPPNPLPEPSDSTSNKKK